MATVDIYIRERNGNREIQIPWLPETIEYESGGATAISYEIMDKGEITVPSGSGLAKIKWKSVFPGEGRTDTSLQRGQKRAPSYFHNVLEDWRQKGASLNILVTGYPINMDVYLSNYIATSGGAFGDMEYSVEFTEEKDIIITTTTTTTKRPASQKSSYMIKKGDTLWSIALRFLGAGSKWESIYTANKTIIESTAKKRGYTSSNNGRRIFPGVTIQIPNSYK